MGEKETGEKSISHCSYLSKPADLGKGELLRPFGMTVLYSGRGF